MLLKDVIMISLNVLEFNVAKFKVLNITIRKSLYPYIGTQCKQTSATMHTFIAQIKGSLIPIQQKENANNE